MHISLPQSVVGAKDALFVVEVAFDAAAAPRTIEIEADAPLQVLELDGSGPGGLYEVGPGFQRLHVPVRLADHGGEPCTIRVRVLDGPDAGTVFERTVRLDAPVTVHRGARPAGKMLVAALVLAALGGLGLLLGPRLLGSGARVPNLIGLAEAPALTAAREAGADYRVVSEEVDRSESIGRVVRMQPAAGERLAEGARITLYVGVPKGDLVQVPDLLGRDGDAAIEALEAAGFMAQEQYEIVDDPRAAGLVRRQAPAAGRHVSRGTTVEVFVGRELDANPLADLPDDLPDDLPGDVTGDRSGDMTLDPVVEAPDDLPLVDAGDAPFVEGPAAADPLADAGRDAGPAAAPTAMPMPAEVPAELPEAIPPLPSPPVELLPPGPGDAEGAPIVDEPALPGGMTAEAPHAQAEVPDPIHTPGSGTLAAPFEGDGDGRPTPGAMAAPDDDKVKVPDVRQMTIDEAEALLDDLGLFPIVDFESRENPNHKNRVMRQSPDPGTEVSAASQVFLTVARLREAAGTAEAPAPGGTPPTTTEPAAPVPAATDPAATGPGAMAPATPGTTAPGPGAAAPAAAAPGSPVPGTPASPASPQPGTVTGPGLGSTPGGMAAPAVPAPPPTDVVPGGADTVRVPDAVARSRDAAENLVRSAGLHYQIELEVTTDLPEGQVISQDPAAGTTLRRGSTVRLLVARPPLEAGVLVPDVIGRTRAEASTILSNERFRVRVRHGGGSSAELGRVTDQAPKAGTRQPRFSWVEIVIATTVGAPHVAARAGEPDPIAADGSASAPAPGEGALLRGPPSLPPGTSFRLPPPTPRGEEPGAAVELPARDEAPGIQTPAVIGHEATAAIEELLRAGFVVVVDPHVAEGPTGRVMAQRPEPGAAARAGDLVRVQVAVAPDPSSASVHLAHTLGGRLDKGRSLLGSAGAATEVVVLDVPGHPYAGSRRVAAQFPAGSVPRSRASIVRLWIIK